MKTKKKALKLLFCFSRERTNLAVGEFLLHLPAGLVHKVVDHGHGDTDGQDGHDGESDRRVGDVAVRLQVDAGLHFLFFVVRPK